VAGDECGGAEEHRKLVTGSVVVAADLVHTRQDTQAIECGNMQGQEAIEHGANAPAVEARRSVCLVFRARTGLVECRAQRELQRRPKRGTRDHI
jgi:hypothetical protein